MKLEDIFSLWETDAQIDKNNLGTEALEISKLHHKYFKILSNERLVLRKYEADLKELKLQKYEFYILGPTEETHAKGWKLPPVGKVLKADIGQYMDADPDIIKQTLKIAAQNEKLELLESILKTVMNRNFNISAFINWEKFRNGIA